MITHYGGTSWELLTDAFLVGAGNNYSVNATGGSDTVTLTESNLPSHSHTYYRSSTSTDSHTLTVDEIPSHTHNLKYATGARDIGAYPDIGSGTAVGSETTASTGGGGGHTHSITRTSVSSGSTGSGTAFSILPTYIAVYMWRRTA